MSNNSTNNTIQVVWVLLGSVSAFVFTLVSSMLLSRYFNKEDYGTYKQVMYIYNSLLVIMTLGLPRAYSFFLPRVSNDEAKDLINKINAVLLGLGGIMSLIFFFGSSFIAGIMNNPSLATPIKYFSLVPLFMLPTMGLDGILSAYKQSKFIAIYNVSTRIFMLICVVAPVIFFNGSVESALLGFTISSFLTFLLALYFKHRPVRKFKKLKSPYSLNDIFKYTFPIMGASLWGLIISSSDQFFISRYFGNVVFAEFSNGTLELPFIGMIISATSIILSPLFSKLAHTENSQQEIISLWKSVFNKNIMLIYPLIVYFFCFAEEIMVVLYGGQYANSGIFFKIKLIVNFFTIIAYSPLMLAIGGERYYFRVHMTGAIVLIVLQYIALKLFNDPLAILIVSVACQISRIFLMLGYISRQLNMGFHNLFNWKLILYILIPALIFVYSIDFFLTNLHISNSIVFLILSGALYAGCFALWSWYKKIDYFSIIKPILNRIR